MDNQELTEAPREAAENGDANKIAALLSQAENEDDPPALMSAIVAAAYKYVQERNVDGDPSSYESIMNTLVSHLDSDQDARLLDALQQLDFDPRPDLEAVLRKLLIVAYSKRKAGMVSEINVGLHNIDESWE